MTPPPTATACWPCSVLQWQGPGLGTALKAQTALQGTCSNSDTPSYQEKRIPSFSQVPGSRQPHLCSWSPTVGTSL